MIETKRLHIRYATLDDLDDIYAYMGDDDVMKYERENYPTKDSYKEVLEYLVNYQLLYVVIPKGTTRVIGHIYLGKHGAPVNNEYNIGYIFHPAYHNKGYCTEASIAVIAYGFSELNANRVRAACNPENTPSWRVMEKAGLLKEGYFPKSFYIRDDDAGQPIYTDEVVYGIQRDDWKLNIN